MCNLCKELDPALSNRENARRLGVNESTVRRHKRKHDQFLVQNDIPENLVTSRGMSVRDPETGSWEKVTWKPNAKAVHDALQFDDLSPLLDNWSPSRYNDKGNPIGDVLNIADLQIGKAMEWGGGTKETLARATASVQAFAAQVERDKPQQVIIADNGDPIENCWNTSSQRATNDMDVPEQIRTFRRFMLETIKLLSPLVPELTYVAVPSNHGQARVGFQQDSSTVDADFGLEVSYQIEDAIGLSPFLSDRVQFARPQPLYTTAVADIANTRIAFNHGHLSRGQKDHANWWRGQDHGRLPGWDADILVVAHYHNMKLEQSGNGRWIISCASCDPGSSWFTAKTGEAALPGMTAFKVHDGQWKDLRLV